MPFVINGKKFDADKSEVLYSTGQGDAACRRDGALTVLRSPKGTLWAIHAYWPNAYGDQRVETVSGDAAVRRLCESLNRIKAIEAAFGEMEEG